MTLGIDAQALEQRKAERGLIATWRLLGYSPWRLVEASEPAMRRNLACFDLDHPMYLFTYW